jgi:predicted nucleic acid-binding protein
MTFPFQSGPGGTISEKEMKEITQKYGTAIGAHDIKLLKAIMTDHVVWSMPGKSLMSGEAHAIAVAGEHAGGTDLRLVSALTTKSVGRPRMVRHKRR